MSRSEERLRAAVARAAAFYRTAIEGPSGEGPRAYLRTRRLEASLDDPRWTIGYAPSGWTVVTQHLRGQGFTDAELLDAGLATPARTGHLVDRFRDRLVLGARDVDGRLVGFIGRAAPLAASGVPRYLDSPATAIYRKSELLFGLSEQSPALAGGDTPVLVEGPLDVLAIAAGTTGFGAVAPGGTALQERQVAHLRATASSGTVIVGFDADVAGTEAARSAYALLVDAFADVRRASWRASSDPASTAAADSRKLRNALTGTRPLADLLIDHAVARHPDHRSNADARINALHEAAALTITLGPRDIPRQVARIADQLGLEPALVRDDLAVASRRSAGRRASARRAASSEVGTPTRPERPYVR